MDFGIDKVRVLPSFEKLKINNKCQITTEPFLRPKGVNQYKKEADVPHCLN